MSLLDLLGRVTNPYIQKAKQVVTPVVKKAVESKQQKQTAQPQQSLVKPTVGGYSTSSGVDVTPQSIEGFTEGDTSGFSVDQRIIDNAKWSGDFELAQKMDALALQKKQFEKTTGREMTVGDMYDVKKTGVELKKAKEEYAKYEEEQDKLIPPILRKRDYLETEDYETLIDYFMASKDYVEPKVDKLEMYKRNAQMIMGKSSLFNPSTFGPQPGELRMHLENLERQEKLRAEAKQQFESLTPRQQLNISLDLIYKQQEEFDKAQEEYIWRVREDAVKQHHSWWENTWRGDFKEFYNELDERDQKEIDRRAVYNQEIAKFYKQEEDTFKAYEKSFWNTEAGERRKVSAVLEELKSRGEDYSGSGILSKEKREEDPYGTGLFNEYGAFRSPVMRGLATGASFGVYELIISNNKFRKDMERGGYSPNTLAAWEGLASLQRGLDIADKATEFVGSFAGAGGVYMGIAKNTSKALYAIPKVGEFFAKAPVTLMYATRNLAETGVESAVRLASGQRWGAVDIVLDLALGTVIESAMARNEISGFIKNRKKVLDLVKDLEKTGVDVEDLSNKIGRVGITEETQATLFDYIKTAEQHDVYKEAIKIKQEAKGAKLNDIEKLEAIQEAISVGTVYKVEKTLKELEMKKNDVLTEKEVENAISEVKVGKKTVKELMDERNATPYKETPSAKDYNKYKEAHPEIEFKDLDDMKLLRDRKSGDIVGVENRKGDKTIFSEAGEKAKTINKENLYKGSEGEKQINKPMVERLFKRMRDKGFIKEADLEDLPKRGVRTDKTFSKEMGDFITEDKEKAIRVALLQEEMPKNKDFYASEVHTALIVSAEEAGDIKTLTRLSTSSDLVDEATEMGRFIRGFAGLDPDSSYKAMRDVKLKKAENAIKKAKGDVSDTKNEIKRLRKKQEEKLNRLSGVSSKNIDYKQVESFIHSITC